MNPLISIIVPVYNVEKYLEDCVKSVLRQTYQNIEILLIDDGSTDNSSKLCDDLKNVDSRIKVFHKQNEGLSSTRNYGIDRANGKYVLFLDSDDYYFDDNAITNMVNYAEKNNLQVVVSPFIYEIDGVKSKTAKYVVNTDLSKLSVYEAYKYMVQNACFLVSACTKLLSLEFIKENNIYFINNIIGEDNDWTFKIMRSVERIGNIKNAYYVYRQNRTGSITNTNIKKQIEDMLYIINSSIEFYKKDNNNEYKDLELSFCAFLWCICLAKSMQLKDKCVIKNVKKISSILNYDLYPKVKYVKIFYSIFRANITGFILKKYMLSRDRRNAK